MKTSTAAGTLVALAVSLTLTLTSARSQTTPRSLMAVPGDGQVALTWDAAPNAAGYNVKRASTAAGSFVVIATNAQDASLVVTNLKNGTANFYAVTSLEDGFESADTPRIRATPGTKPGR